MVRLRTPEFRGKVKVPRIGESWREKFGNTRQHIRMSKGESVAVL